MSQESDPAALDDEIQYLTEIMDRIRDEVAKQVIGQRHMIDGLLMALLTNGHVLLEGVPGLAKTTVVKAFAGCLNLVFRRIQFTPDMLPADLTGTLIYDPKTQSFYAKKGPLFANIVLADEINRAPAKVQSALLEAMQERQITLGDETHPLSEPFLVMATQNPIEQEGTYPLPEAQTDRFMFKIIVDYPTPQEEKQILALAARVAAPWSIEPVTDFATIQRARELVDQVYIDEKIQDYIVSVVAATRRPQEYGLDELRPLIQYGASVRASLYLVLAAKARALLNKRAFVVPQDVKDVSEDVLRHRIIPSYEAEAENVHPEDLIQRVFAKIPVP